MSSQLTNPFDDPFEQIKKRALLHMKGQAVSDKIRSLAEETFTTFLRGEQIVYTRNEKKRLYKAVLQDLFEEILAGV